MAQERISMRKIKEVLRLHFEAKISQAKISVVAGISRYTVQQYIIRFLAAGLNWPSDLSDGDLERKLFPVNRAKNNRPEPDYLNLLQEIRKPDATLVVLWEEYKRQYPNGYQYSYFCDLFNAYRGRLNYSMRQEHKAGEKTFIDFGDSPLKIIHPQTGAERSTKIFVCVWGASSYMFAEGCFDEKLATWIKLNINALEYFGCCPRAMVPDNLKSAVSKASRYEPDINPTYAEFAGHYGTVIFPARPYRPKDKSKAENGVKLAKRWILFRLRNVKFYSLAELNIAIGILLKEFNKRIMKKFQKSRRELFELLDKPHALKLPDSPYEFAEWKKAKVQFNYHVGYEGHNYSVPYTFIHKEVDIKAASTLIEIYHHGKRICSHVRNNKAYGYTTVTAHMPQSHQRYLEWTPDRILHYAEKHGPAVKALVQKVMESRKFPEQAYKSCLGIIRLENKYSADRLNLACLRALEYRAYSYNSVVNILQKGLDKQNSLLPAKIHIHHENIRGANYYSS
ncbi:MAG: Integrase core domain protein [Smithella sp. PtaU1.Bin162]|nr:MAG: Integrase core domain protein [Smithella sp. PtaU1.Bin162]